MKKFISMAFCLCFVFSFAFNSFATDIKAAMLEGKNITVTISGKSSELAKLDNGNISAKIGETSINADSIKVENPSVDWIVVIDTSKSVKSDFEAEKNSIITLMNSLDENDSLNLYTFDTSVVHVLKGKESKNDAVKKINNIKCLGEDTVVYDMLAEISKTIKSSKSDKCITLIFSDGVDTLSKTKKDAAVKAIKSVDAEFVGFVPGNVSDSKVSAFNNLLKQANGKASSFNAKNVEKKVKDLSGKVESTASVVFKSDSEIDENAEISVRIGDKEPIKAKIEKSENNGTEDNNETQPKSDDTTSAVDATENSVIQETEETKEENEASFPIIPLIAGVAILIAVISLILLKKKKSSPKDDVKEAEKVSEVIDNSDEISDKTESDENPDSEQKKIKQPKKKSQNKVKFYFEGK